jgi:hypothetical protein
MADVTITARVAPMDVSVAARTSGFPGTESRSVVIRYAMLRAIGYTDDMARQRAQRKKINEDTGMIVHGQSAATKIDPELLAEIESNWPDGIENRAMFIRYSLFIASGYTHEESLDEAKREPGRPRKS